MTTKINKDEKDKLARKARKIAIFFVGCVGFFSAILAIYQWSSTLPEPNNIEFIEQSDSSRSYILSTDIVEPFLVQNDIIITGNINIPAEFSLVSNTIHFDTGASIIAPQDSRLLIIAKEIYGGMIKSNGQSGDMGEGGHNAGVVIIVAATVDDFSVQAMGGRGGDGVRGANGAHGRNGRCDGFGGWRKANPGQDGADGGNAGSGGNGGIVRIYAPPNLHIEALVDGGAPGAPGAPGKGGNGGRGCTGLGGSQASRAPGKDGNAGAASLPGSDGIINRSNRSFIDIADRVQTAIRKGEFSYQQLLSVIETHGEAGND